MPGPTIVIPGTFGSGTNVAIPNAPATLASGDVMVAFINIFNDLSGVPPTDMTGGIPAGWSIYRQDPNTGTGSLHGPMYAGIAFKIATGSEPPNYTFTNTGLGHNIINVSLACGRNASGIESSSLIFLNNASTGKIIAGSTLTKYLEELVFVAGLWGTGSGSTISSDNGLSAATPFPSQANQVFYQFSTGPISLPQGLTCTDVSDAFTAYQVSLAPVPVPNSSFTNLWISS